jgi:IclR family transcriptional regulator, KDG regulon repressor
MSRNVQSLERGLAVLEALVKNGSTGVTDIATELDLDKTIVHRLLTTLQDAGYVTQDKNRKYLVGTKLRMIGAKVLASLDLRTQALPYMHQLMEHTKGVAHLAKIAEDRAVYIEKVQHPEFNVSSTGVGGEAPGYCSAAGKVLWAYLPQHELHELLEHAQFRKHTTNTINDTAELQRHLAQVHEQGFSIDLEEHRLGLVGVGAPVMDHTGNVIASICVGGYGYTSDSETIAGTRDLVIDVARRLSRDMGYFNGHI